MAFGDDYVDIGMLKMCGRGVAMGNVKVRIYALSPAAVLALGIYFIIPVMCICGINRNLAVRAADASGGPDHPTGFFSGKSGPVYIFPLKLHQGSAAYDQQIRPFSGQKGIPLSKADF